MPSVTTTDVPAVFANGSEFGTLHFFDGIIQMLEEAATEGGRLQITLQGDCLWFILNLHET